MAKYYYNGVLLPEIPVDVVVNYPYAFIRKNTNTSEYELYITQDPMYYDEKAGSNPGLVTGAGQAGSEYLKYSTAIANAEAATEWTAAGSGNTWFGLDAKRIVMWTSYDIPNGSATSSTIYFYGSEPVPENEAKPKELEYIVYTNFYQNGNTIYYEVDSLTISYVVPVKKYSTYTVTMTEVGNRLRVCYSTKDPATITANTSVTSITEPSSFPVGYTFNYFAQADGWMVVYVSNAGERPKISIVTNGAGGDGAPLYDRKYLVRSGSTLYTIVDGALSALETSDVTAELFRSSGMEEPPTSELLVTLVNPEILYWVDTTEYPIDEVKVIQTAMPFPQTLESPDYFMSDETVLGIEKAIAVATEDVQFAVSFDSGTSWKTFIDGVWAELSENSSGMSATTLNSIPTENWNVMVADGKFRFRISLMDETSEFTSLIVDYLNEAEVPAESNEGDE